MDNEQGQREHLDKLEEIVSGLLEGESLHCLEAERSLLGGILIKDRIRDSIFELISEDDFFSMEHRVIFRACRALIRRSVSVDLLTLASELTSMGKLDDVGGQAYLAGLTQMSDCAAHAVHHAEIIRDYLVKRRLVRFCSDIIVNAAEGTEKIEALLDIAGMFILDLSKSKNAHIPSSAEQMVNNVFEKLTIRSESKEMVTGVPTGFYDFDESTSGLHPSELIIVAGDPFVGKSSFARDIAMRAACMYSVPTLVFSLEMSKEQVMTHMLCAWAKVDLTTLRKGRLDDNDWARLYDAANAVSSAPIFVDDTPALSGLP